MFWYQLNPETEDMFPKGTVKAAVQPAEKPPVTAQKESAVVYMVDNTNSQVVAVNDPYWRTQRARICACAVVLTTLILVAGTLGGITIVLTHENGVETMDTTPSLNHDREPLLSNEVPLPKLPESTILIKIDDGGLIPPTEPATPDLKATDDVTDDVAKELLPAISLSSTDDESKSSVVPSYHHGGNYISPSFPNDRWHANGQEGTPPSERSDRVVSSERARDETDVEVSGDDQENDYVTDEPDYPTPDTSVNFPYSSSDAYHWRSRPSDGLTASISSDWYS